MPKAKVQEEETAHPPEEEAEASMGSMVAPPPEPESAPVVPETPVEETVPKPKAKSKAKAKAKAPKAAPKKQDAWSPGEVSIPQPPALVRQVATEATVPELPELTQAQALRPQAHLRVVNPIRQFYGMSARQSAL